MGSGKRPEGHTNVWLRSDLRAAPALSLAEIGLAHEVGAEELGGGVVQHDAPGLDDVAPVRHAERHPRVLLHEQDRRPLTVDLLDDAEDRVDEDGREAHGRRSEERRVGKECRWRWWTYEGTK